MMMPVLAVVALYWNIASLPLIWKLPEIFQQASMGVSEVGAAGFPATARRLSVSSLISSVDRGSSVTWVCNLPAHPE